MKLILSSCDFRNEKSKKTIIDNLSKPIDQCKLLFIPNEKATHEAIHSEKYFLRMQELGFTKDNIAVFDYYNEQQFINLDLDIIYISGGNTFARRSLSPVFKKYSHSHHGSMSGPVDEGSNRVNWSSPLSSLISRQIKPSRC